MSAPLDRPLRWGLLCAGPELEAAFAASVRELLDMEEVELAVVITQDARTNRTRRTLWDAYLRLRPLHTIPSRQPVDLSPELAGVPRILARDVQEVRAQGLDFVLRAGAGPLDGELLDVPAHGVWSFDPPGDPRSGAAPPGFWEISRSEAATGGSLHRLTADPHEDIVLQRCFVSTKLSSLRTTLDGVARARAFMPARVASDIRNGSAAYLSAPPSAAEAPCRRAPTGAQVLRFWGRTGVAWVKAQVGSIFLLERWHVGIVRHPIESFLSEGFAPEIEWLPYRKARGFLADPFLAGSGAASTILMEEWDDGSRRGSIVGVDLEEGLGGRRPTQALNGATHMSYPYVFEHQGQLFCTPETHERRGVYLYALEAGEARWQEHATLLEGVAAVDPTLVQHGGRWWLFCTDEKGDAEGKLLLWHSPELLGPWEPHPANPVKADIRSSRPAGTPFLAGGKLYRPAQDSAGGYGRAVVINRVTRLTTTEYAEEPVARFSPPPGSPYPAGAHTLAGWGDLTAVDGKRVVVAPHLVVPRIAWKLRRLMQKIRG